MSNIEKFRWLHLSDLHVGANHLAETWPRFNTIFLDDLERRVKTGGSLDVIVFSGDLVQFGTQNEFDIFDEVIDSIMTRLAEIQERPKIVTVPGNHDLERPSKDATEALVLKQYWNDVEVEKSFWSDTNDSLIQFVGGRFETYRTWRNNAIKSGLHMKPICEGRLVGDATYQLEKTFGKLGFVCLNSTWLQLSGGDYKGRLHVDIKQLLAITDGDADKWCRQNLANLLITHQPSNWLKVTEPSSWPNDINPPGRFDLHLFGHMHEPIVERHSVGGGQDRRSVQAASLFGLQTFGQNNVHRIQGYSVNEIKIVDGCRTFKNWPRQLQKVAGGVLKLVPDSTQDIDEESGSFSYGYETSSPQIAVKGDAVREKPTSNSSIKLAEVSSFDPHVLAMDINDLVAHESVRLVEQEKCVRALQDSKIVWLASDWGMGKEGFIASVVGKLGISFKHVFLLDLGEYQGRETFLRKLASTYGASLNQICDAISEFGNVLLVLDDVDVASLVSNETDLISDVEKLSQTIIEYAPEIRILIRCRKPPTASSKEIIELAPLDEAEVASYAKASGAHSYEFGQPDNASILYRHTDGVPTRVDTALSDLEFMTIQELIASNSDYGDEPDHSVTVPTALVRTVGELARSDDPGAERAYKLLLILTALPQGDSLSRLKRVLGPHPIFPAHARQLTQRSLINSVSKQNMGGMAGESAIKILVVSRPVREYVHRISDDAEAARIDRQLIGLFFGSDWRTGEISNSQMGKKLKNPHCDDYEILNAGTLINRSLRRAILEGDGSDITSTVYLASSFVSILMDGDHFRNAASVCEEIIALLDEQTETYEKQNFLRYEWARALRMTGNASQARDILESVEFSLLSKDDRGAAELNLALCFEKLGDKIEARNAANRVIATKKHGGTVLQAKAIIAEQEEDHAKRESELKKLLTQAKRQKSWTLVSNLLLTLARLARSKGEADDKYVQEAVSTSRENKDYYNSARAIVQVSSARTEGTQLTDTETSRLVAVYHYLYNERLFSLFEKCHAALWRVFEENGDIQNLLRLFRRSSFIWRLNNLDDQEKKYLEKLKNMGMSSTISLKGTTDRDGVYYLVRVSLVLGTDQKAMLPKE